MRSVPCRNGDAAAEQGGDPSATDTHRQFILNVARLSNRGQHMYICADSIYKNVYDLKVIYCDFEVRK